MILLVDAAPGFRISFREGEGVQKLNETIMFPASTQAKHWIFPNRDELKLLRKEANHKFLNDHAPELPASERAEKFLTFDEEWLLLKHYEYILKEFCSRFQPPMNRGVVGTAMAYFKRIFVHNSLMDFHPRDMMLTCIYLACKVDEFNVSIDQFVKNLKGDRDKYADLILKCELLLMQLLHYHLTIHSPYRPMEGFLLDLKTRCTTVADGERMRQGAEDFLDRSLNTDVLLLYSPSQIAIAALLHAASKSDMKIEGYVIENFLKTEDQRKMQKIVEKIKGIRYLVKNQDVLNRDRIRQIERKLEACRNQEMNPLSDSFKRKHEQFSDEEDFDSSDSKRRRVDEEESETL